MQRVLQAVASNQEVASARTTRTVAATSYTKCKAISITVAGQYRIRFGLSNGNPISGQIYRTRGGSSTAVGTERILTGSPDAPTFYVEDIGGWEIGDSCELRAKAVVATSGSAYALVLSAEYGYLPPPIPAGKVLTDTNV